MIAADFLGNHVPLEWVQDCEATQALTVKLQGLDKKLSWCTVRRWFIILLVAAGLYICLLGRRAREVS
jgi:hypothetical protein